MEEQVTPTNVVVRFPDGSREFRYPQEPLKEGDIIWHDGMRYRILALVQNDGGPASATVEPESDGLGALLISEEGALRLELVP
jgi:hypothetical protein